MREYEIGGERKDKTKVSFIAQGVAEANYIAGEHYNRTAGSGAPQVSARLPDTQPECQSNNSSFSQAPEHLSHYPPQSHWLQEPENLRTTTLCSTLTPQAVISSNNCNTSASAKVREQFLNLPL